MKRIFSSCKSKLKKGLISVVLSTCIVTVCHSQRAQTVVYDVYHGQNLRNMEVFNGLVEESHTATFIANENEITDATLNNKDVLVLFSLSKKLEKGEKRAIIKFVEAGGALLLIMDEARRSPISLEEAGANDVLAPFGLELTGDAPVRHNCGAIAEKSEVSAETRELPYSGGRSINGGTVISRVNDEGNYVHSAFVETKKGGKVLVMSDGMAGLLMGGPDGVRFSGTDPSNSKYWGKDSKIFMKEVFAFLLK